MRVAALFSGGKDSTYAAKLAEDDGNNVAFLVSLRSTNPDSYMFHTVNQHITGLLAEAIGKQLITARTSGVKEKELLDLELVLKDLKIDGVVSGAIASNYQRTRIMQICNKLGFDYLSPLWGRERLPLISEMLKKGMKIIITSVAAQGLDQTWLGRLINRDTISKLKTLNDKYGLDVCGEGGEYESLVLDAPWFKKKVKIVKKTKIWDGMSGKYLVKEAQLLAKSDKNINQKFYLKD
jgi:ABC transporter with metal-binding/Fe-S-binding domain ATP-binding protein